MIIKYFFKKVKKILKKRLDFHAFVWYNLITVKEVRTTETKDWVGVILTIWSNTVATIALVLSIKEKRKTAKRSKPRKHKRKR